MEWGLPSPFTPVNDSRRIAFPLARSMSQVVELVLRGVPCIGFVPLRLQVQYSSVSCRLHPQSRWPICAPLVSFQRTRGIIALKILECLC
jgi:hypothetical protein